MKYICVLLAFIGVGQFSFAQTETLFPELQEANLKARLLEGNHPSMAVSDRSAVYLADITYGRFRWTVDPAVRYISGAVLYQFQPKETINTWDLDLEGSLQVDSVLWQGQSIDFDQSVPGIVQIIFPQSLPAGVSDAVEIFYQGEPGDSGFGSFITTTHQQGTVPVLWTLSEPYGARDWFPCHQDLNDKVDSCDIFITAPAGNRAASNGVLISETTDNGWITAHWQTHYPTATYLLCMAVTNYAVYEEEVHSGNGVTRVVNYVYPESLDQAQIESAEIAGQMILFDSLFGTYPFRNEKYGHAQFSWGGGMEHQTISFMVNFNWELMAHELAHHWFGDMITCGSWEDIWLNEGFATYLAGLCYENLRPQYWLSYRQNRLNSVVSQPGGSLWVDDTTNVYRIFSGRLSYAKGALVLHQLRWLLGDDAFFAALRNYLNDPALAFGYARTADLQAHLEQTSGQDLDAYFADWYTGEGFPTYQVQWSQDAGNKVNIVLGQTTSMPGSVSFFALPVPIQFVGPGGKDTTLVLEHSYSGQNFSAQLDFPVVSVVFDPELWLISADNVVNQTSGLAAQPNPVLANWAISPNPAKDRVVLSLEAQKGASVQAALLVLDGRVIRSWKLDVQQGHNAFPLEIGPLPTGVYQVVLKGEGWAETLKLILE